MSDTPRTDAEAKREREAQDAFDLLRRELAVERKRADEAERMLSIGNKCDECGCSFKGPPCLFVKSGWCKHNEERAMDKTPDAVVVPCSHRFPISNCRHMLPVKGDTSMTHEHYKCDVCGRRESLDYDEMR